MNTDVEFHIRHNYPWNKLPANIKQILGNSQREYEKNVVTFSIKNQLRYKGNLVRTIKKDEKKYYEILVQYSREHLMLYPYHLSDVMVKGLRITPFTYYINIMSDIMAQDKSYDALPNFTAADCLRLMGIGRNQYIDLMNQTRTSKAHRIFRKKPTRDLLPSMPVETISIEPWWVVQAGYITEDDVKVCNVQEKAMIDKVIDKAAVNAGTLDYTTLHSLYRKGLVYLDVVIADEDCIIVPPLEGFVMNRVLGDYFETLLYKIFVSIDEHTNVEELANVLQIDLQLVKNAVCMYCRLGFARRKGYENNIDDLHPSWNKSPLKVTKKAAPEELLIDWSTTDVGGDQVSGEKTATTPDDESIEAVVDSTLMNNVGHSKRIAFLFDSTLTAFLMMGNLSPGLKSHAVTMFEVGKLSDESMDSFLAELEKVDSTAEGEAQRYFDHAITLRDTVKFLRFNKDLTPDPEFNNTGLGVDLLRCESLLGLDPGTCSRLLNKNYSLLVSMAPLSNEIRPISSCTPQHIGPAIPEVSSVWFKLFIYHLTGCGPPTLMLCKGTKLRRLPKVLQDYDKLLITTWGHDPAVIATSNVLLTLNDALTHSAVLVQAHGWQADGCTMCIPFPLLEASSEQTMYKKALNNHSAIKRLSSKIDLMHTCGFITLLKTGMPDPTNTMLRSMSRHNSASERSSSIDCFSVSSDKPTNGIKDLKSAEILASELDSLDSLPKSPEKALSLDLYLGDADTSSADTTCDQSCHVTVESEWVLLDCCFGIPLFESHVNREICERIVSQGLCDRESLQMLLHSSRKLSLCLQDFIAEYREAALSEECGGNPPFDTNSSPKGRDTLPYPTHNLIFQNGSLEAWGGR